MNHTATLSFHSEFPSSQIWVRHRNVLLEIIPLVTQSRLLDKVACVGAFIGLGPYNVRALLHARRNLELLAQFFFFLVKIFKSENFCMYTYPPLFMGINQVILSFPATAPVLWVLKNSIPMPGKIQFNTPSVRGFFKKKKNKNKKKMHTKIPTSQKWENTSKGAGLPSASH